MGRLVVAVLILFAVLAGLRVANSSLFQRNVANQINSAAADTRSTGFSAEAIGTSSGSVAGSGVASQSASTQNFNQTGTAANTTALPPSQPSAVPARW